MPEPTTKPDDALLAGQARRMIEMHNGEWDSLHAFATLHWDGTAFSIGTWAAIDTGYSLSAYPAIMRKMSSEAIGRDRESPPYAYALQIEAHVSGLPAEAPAEDLAAMAADLNAGKLHLRPGARECVQAWVADIHGRLWFARKFRDAGAIEEEHWPATAPQRDLLTASLVATGRMTGLAAWGLEPTPEEQAAYDAVRDRRERTGQ
jgi:hypothetical protein